MSRISTPSVDVYVLSGSLWKLFVAIANENGSSFFDRFTDML
uniref:Uncharacterized protein n=1 Tax=Anguilla anguilla TaxID=7936 RepID=A0A0E9VJN3_ANGAN